MKKYAIGGPVPKGKKALSSAAEASMEALAQYKEQRDAAKKKTSMKKGGSVSKKKK